VSDPIQELLRENGVQVTAQRLALMRVIAEKPHATADELGDEVRSILGAISRQAVYDALGVLVDKNLVRRIQPAGSAARYENRVGDNHHHLICRGCRTMFDVDCATGEVPCLTADDDHGFEVDEAEVIYWGRCPTCRKSASDTTADTARTSSKNNKISRQQPTRRTTQRATRSKS
jgi:Fe2+ or Zn2+ uptake regulation protein